MPHVIVKLFPGRTEDQKKLCTEKITQVIIETLNTDEKSVSVAFEEVPRESWKETVYEPDILSKEETLYKKPGYTM
ncbi:MAG TPA: 4-oxalocrotonate tautomerase [Clostridiaceae bacterium]|nr:4-oxalocrotonate tautomerase [Clostridiaceae bacterium]